MAKFIEPDELFYKEFEPKQQHRFWMSINGIPSYIIKTAERPKLSIDPVILEHINVNRKIQGKGKWEDMNITLYDPISPSGAQAVMNWLRSGYEWSTGRAGYADFYKKEITLSILDGVGAVIEEWQLKGAWISSADWGKVDWAAADPIEITLTITYDYAVLQY